MTPVYQTIIGGTNDKIPGNCMQAAYASLLDLPLEEVPNFISYGNNWFSIMYHWLLSKGIEHSHWKNNPCNLSYWGEREEFESISNLNGIRGYFYASVYSPAFFKAEDLISKTTSPATHAVIIDKDFNIVHDPNPLNKDVKEYPLAHRIGFNGVLSVPMLYDLHGMWL